MANLFKLNICLDEIPNGILEHSFQGNNGKTYFSATIVERKEKGKFGDTHFVKISHKDEQGKWNDTIIGSIKPIDKTTIDKPTNDNKTKPIPEAPF